MDRVTVRSYRIVDHVPEQVLERLLRYAPFAERTQCYTDPARATVSADRNTAISISLPVAGTRIVLIIGPPPADR